MREKTSKEAGFGIGIGFREASVERHCTVRSQQGPLSQLV
jgi:hypothetical protein